MPNEKGQIGNQNVLKQAVAAQGAIYQTSALLSTLNKMSIPMETTEVEMYIWDVTSAESGEFDVGLDAYVDPTRVAYKQIKTSIKWSNYTYDITESAKLRSRDMSIVWADNARSASEYFAAIMDHQGITDLKAKAGNTVAAGALWSSEVANPEEDIVNAVKKIVSTSNVKPDETIYVLVPVEVYFETKKLQLINNIQRTLQNYLEDSFNLSILPFRPHNTGLDALGNDALVLVGGMQAGKVLQFDERFASMRGVQLIEHERIAGRGDRFIQKMGIGFLTFWDGKSANYTDETTYTTNKVYVIQNVKA